MGPADEPLPATTDQGPPTSPLPTAPVPSAEIPGYEVLGELGRGGMGVVYKARQVGLDRIVALKMILAGAHAAAQQVARFHAEAKTVARFQHPNIVQVYEEGEHAGLPFFVLEYVEGGSLAQRLASGPWAPREAARLVEVVSRAVEAAHAWGIVHRDLKPANILVTADGTPKVADFGVAKHLHRAEGLTDTGAVLGTPGYMAPEQAWGSPRDVRPATDVYSLGAILYELLTGRPPFTGPNPFAVLDQVRSHPPLRPRQVRPGVPLDLEAVCLKCLAKEPEERYPTAEALADDLKRFLDGVPVRARPAPRWRRALYGCGRRPVAVAAGLVFGVVAIALLGFAGWLPFRGGTDPGGHPAPPSPPPAPHVVLPHPELPGPAIDLDALRPGQEPVPGYRLVEMLGRGDFGAALFKAEGPGGVPVALEFTPRTEQGRERSFIDRSAELIKGIRHPNLLPMFGLWRVGEVRVVATELYDQTLESRLREATGKGRPGIPLDELLPYVEDAARGIDFLNETRHFLDGGKPVSLIHGDIKPGNLCLVGGRVKVVQFHLIEAFDPTGPDQEGEGRGTPLYMAPERLAGKTALQTDQYSLAATYYHLRTGRLLFETDDGSELFRKIVEGAPDLGGLADAERGVVARALSRRPGDRWPSCLAFVNALTEATKRLP